MPPKRIGQQVATTIRHAKADLGDVLRSEWKAHDRLIEVDAVLVAPDEWEASERSRSADWLTWSIDGRVLAIRVVA